MQKIEEQKIMALFVFLFYNSEKLLPLIAEIKFKPLSLHKQKCHNL